MNNSKTNSIHAGFDQKIMEIGYMGAFYGLLPQARAIFDFYGGEHHQHDHGRPAFIAAKLGEALALIGEQNYCNAADVLEKLIEECGEENIPEAKIFLVLAYKKAKTRADRIDSLLTEMKGSESEAVADAVDMLAAS